MKLHPAILCAALALAGCTHQSETAKTDHPASTVPMMKHGVAARSARDVARDRVAARLSARLAMLNGAKSPPASADGPSALRRMLINGGSVGAPIIPGVDDGRK